MYIGTFKPKICILSIILVLKIFNILVECLNPFQPGYH